MKSKLIKKKNSRNKFSLRTPELLRIDYISGRSTDHSVTFSKFEIENSISHRAGASEVLTDDPLRLGVPLKFRLDSVRFYQLVLIKTPVAVR